ncbi:MAG: glycosyltransferase [Candidatus Paceibacterota bacterium]
MLKILRKIYSIYNRQLILRNVFNRNHKKKVLISYITFPFKRPNLKTHTNIQESLVIAKVFDELGFICDVVDYNSTKKIAYEDYDVVFGFGDIFDKSFSTSKKILRIYYGTGRHPYFSNVATIKRGIEVYEKSGVLLKESLRFIEKDYAIQTIGSDALVLLGDHYLVDTYKKYTNTDCYNLNVSFIELLNPMEIINDKDFSEGKKHFLFFSGGGMIHKGLDVLLDAFSKRQDLHLHVCAPLQNEKRFVKIFSENLKSENIHLYDFVKIESDNFKKILTKCAFVILPSCSEAMPTSVVNVCANGGLIPILTNEASIKQDELSILIREISADGVLDSLDLSQTLDNIELKRRSIGIVENILRDYSLESFNKNFKEILSKILI